MRFVTGSAIALGVAGAALSPKAAAAQDSIVSVCSGVSLPRSVVTDLVAPIANGITQPVQGALNPLIALVGALLPGAPGPIAIDVSQLVANAAASGPITLQVLDVDGNLVGAATDCVNAASAFELDTAAGIALGGNRITGLGATGQVANAAHVDAIALGNNAKTGAAAAGAIALGANAEVAAGANGAMALGAVAFAGTPNSVALGAGSVASSNLLTPAYVPGSGAVAGSIAYGEVSIGAPGGERRITNVAAGAADTDAATVGQLRALADSWSIRSSTPAPPSSDPAPLPTPAGTQDAGAVRYDTDGQGRRANSVTLAGGDASQPVAVRNVARGSASTDAVNVEQLEERVGQVYQHFNRQIAEVRSEASQAAAVGLAAAAIRFDSRPGKISLGLGTGVWRGEYALALGLGYTTPDGMVQISGSAATSGGHFGGGAGMTITFN